MYLHWSWFILAWYSIQARVGQYDSHVWPVLEYLALFLTVLLHEFGHSLACRQVGGQADQIVLWPFGGVAYVAPPPRPGATLWSIAAGPLVNVVLLPLFLALTMLAREQGWGTSHPDAYQFLGSMAWLNSRLLMFNLLPIYPLDGGQILRSLLWFPLGRARSLLAASVIGFAGVLALFAWAFFQRSPWLGAITVFVLMNCWQGFVHARALMRIEKAPRRPGYACPACGAPPIAAAIWRCQGCGTPSDVFLSNGVCPNCQRVADAATCTDCGSASPLSLWRKLPPPPPV